MAHARSLDLQELCFVSLHALTLLNFASSSLPLHTSTKLSRLQVYSRSWIIYNAEIYGIILIGLSYTNLRRVR